MSPLQTFPGDFSLARIEIIHVTCSGTVCCAHQHCSWRKAATGTLKGQGESLRNRAAKQTPRRWVPPRAGRGAEAGDWGSRGQAPDSAARATSQSGPLTCRESRENAAIVSTQIPEKPTVSEEMTQSRRAFSWADERRRRASSLQLALPPVATRNGLAWPTRIGAPSAPE